ncbi:MAG TPA: rhodanese-like domain-containing protein [Polyangia bacterium]|nr:rhodanese-like domain-containing protein [Polyangia bacterium]
MSVDLRISVDDVARRLERGEPVLFVDVRNPTAWGEAREQLPGALRVSGDQVERAAASLPRGRPIVTYCT